MGEPHELISMPVVDAIRLAVERADTAEVLRLVETSPLEVWYGVPLDEIRTILNTVREEDFDRSGFAYAVRVMLNPDRTAKRPPKAVAATYFTALEARLAGSPVTAAELLRRFAAEAAPAQPLFDRTGGFDAFARLHTGFTFLLAGDLTAARTSISSVMVTPPPRQLTMLLRDAYAKSAVQNALFGACSDAHRDLDIADTLPRTTSWAEPIVDAHLEIARCLMVPDAQIDEAIFRLERLPASVVGEMWPLWLLAIFLLHLRRGTPQEGLARAEVLAAATPLSAAREGFPVSVLPIARAVVALVASDSVAVRGALREADDRVAVVRLIAALGVVQRHSSGSATAELVALGTEFAGFETLDALRVVTLAWAMLRAGDEHSAERMLRALVKQHSPVAPPLLTAPAAVDHFARERVEGWVSPLVLIPQDEHESVLLTEREREVLALLASDLTREQIAEELFVSVNTIKSQMSSIFRKLDVGTRLDAVLHAERFRLL